MNYKIPGLSSIALMFIAIVLADIRLFTISITSGVIYTVLIPILFLFVLYCYCRKCPHSANGATKGTCRHVILGKITSSLFGNSKPAKYTIKEILSALIPLLILIAFPQYWLFRDITLFIVFWILMLAAGIIVRTGVCPGCKNVNCGFCPNE